MTADPVLRSTRAGDGSRVLVLALARPDALNAIDNALLAVLHAALDDLEQALAADPLAVRAVVIAGDGGRAFSTGMDLKERATFDDDALRAQRRDIVRLVTRVHGLPVPVVAAVEGFALAGGF